MEKNSINGAPVAPWVITVCYILGWIFGALLLLRVIFGIADYNGILLATGLYLIFFPIFREGPDVVLGRILGGQSK